NLERWKALVAQPPRRVGALFRRAALAARSVHAYPIAAPAEQLPERLAADLAHEIPERYLERPHTPVVELEIVENADVSLDLERVAAQEQVLVAGEAKHRVARANALVVAGAHAH